MIASTSTATQVCMLSGITRPFTTVDEYRRGDEVAIAAHSMSSEQGCEEFALLMLDRRNARFTDRAEALFDTSPLIAVGALHLMGRPG
jgi:uncharacterized protein YbaP (TraB family)